VEGRLRDVDDFTTSPAVLSWFTNACDHMLCSQASLMWEIDRGPRYRFEANGLTLTRVRGVLDA
jgi:hypothetical protein